MIKKRIIIDLEIEANGTITEPEEDNTEFLVHSKDSIELITLDEYADLIKETLNPYGNEDLLQRLSSHLEFDAGEYEVEDIVTIKADLNFEDLK